MEFIEEEAYLLLKVDNDDEREELWGYHNANTLHSNDSMYEFFEYILANSHFEWIAPEEVGALTDAPLLGYRNEKDEVVEVYGHMNYCIKSLLEELFVHEEIKLDRGL